MSQLDKSISEMTDEELTQHLGGLETQKQNLQREVNAERARRLQAENANLVLQQQQNASAASRHSTLDSGLGSSTMETSSSRNTMVLSSKQLQPPNINEVSSYDGWLNTPCLASPQPQVSYPRAGPPPPSLIHMVELGFVGLSNNPKRIIAQWQKLGVKLERT